MAIIGIVAISQDFAIGRGGKLPWYYPADLKHFKKTTIGNAVVMGRATWEELGKPLPDRLNITLSRTTARQSPSSVLHLASKEQVIELARYLDGDMFIIGGAKTFAEFADEIEKWVVTQIPENHPDADTFMPTDFLADFVDETSTQIDENLTVRTLRRKSK